MFLLGHIGITLGIIFLMAWIIYSRFSKDKPKKSFVSDIDFRIVVIAAILPDIIDKVVGMILFKDEIANGRLFTHSALIIGMLSLCILILAKIQFKNKLYTLYYIPPLWIHLILDRMWETPRTLFWPLFGTDFPKLEIEISNYFTMLFTEPYIFIGEIVGSLIIITLVVRFRLFTKRSITGFLKDGKLRMPPSF